MAEPDALLTVAEIAAELKMNQQTSRRPASGRRRVGAGRAGENVEHDATPSEAPGDAGEA